MVISEDLGNFSAMDDDIRKNSEDDVSKNPVDDFSEIDRLVCRYRPSGVKTPDISKSDTLALGPHQESVGEGAVVEGQGSEFSSSGILSSNPSDDFIEQYYAGLKAYNSRRHSRKTVHHSTRVSQHTYKGPDRFRYDSPAGLFDGWDEIDLRSYVDEMDYSESKIFKHLKVNGTLINIKDTGVKGTGYIDGTKSAMPVKVSAKKGKSGKGSKGTKGLNDIVLTLQESYTDLGIINPTNEIFLNMEGDRVYGFYLLNMHSADIDVNMGDSSKDNHLMIRYNENTHAGWETRMQYIDRIFSGMGFETKISEGYLFMQYVNPGDRESMRPILKEAVRGLVSTTHLNITLGDVPELLETAVNAFQEGKTQLYTYLESLPEYKEKMSRKDHYGEFSPYLQYGLGGLNSRWWEDSD